ncbi:MAG: alpha/beta hydrolase [Deltaproteobacteria bacterium]|nr:alpha/beta hydrolase [Deltaproteobacteria bacterium]
MPHISNKDSVSIHYETLGSGPPLVFVHGWSFSGSVWRFQKEALSNRYQCVCMDLRGHGQSSAPATGYALDDFASDLTALFERLDLSRASILGWSLGALVALAAHRELRERLASLVLVSGTSRFVACEGYPHGLPSKEPRGLALRLKRNPQQAMDAFFRGMFTPEELAGNAFKHIEKEVVLPSQSAALQSLETLASADVRYMLSSVQLPVLLVHGDRDTVCPADASRYMAEMLPCASLAILEGAGHAPMLTRRSEFDCLVGSFLERVYGTD